MSFPATTVGLAQGVAVSITIQAKPANPHTDAHALSHPHTQCDADAQHHPHGHADSDADRDANVPRPPSAPRPPKNPCG